MANRARTIERIATVVVSLYWLIVIGVLIYGVCMDPTMRTLFWYRFAQLSQRVAYRMGRIGLEAEAAYFAALERSRL